MWSTLLADAHAMARAVDTGIRCAVRASQLPAPLAAAITLIPFNMCDDST